MSAWVWVLYILNARVCADEKLIEFKSASVRDAFQDELFELFHEHPHLRKFWDDLLFAMYQWQVALSLGDFARLDYNGSIFELIIKLQPISKGASLQAKFTGFSSIS